MSDTKNKDKINPKSRASAISVILFSWMTGLLYTGWKRPLTEDDIYPPLHGDHSSVLGQRLYYTWEKHVEACAKKQKKPNFGYAVFKTFYKPFLFYGVFSVVEECVIRLVQVIALGDLIDYFNEDEAKLNSYLVAQTAVSGIIMSSVLFMLSFHWSLYGCHHTCTQIRIAVSSMIFRKTLRLSQSTLKYFSVGQLITMLSSDVHRFDQQDLHLNYIWIAPVHLGIVIYILFEYYKFGWPSIAGLGLLLLFVLCQYIITRYIAKVRLNKIIASHSRMKIILEIMQAFNTIKMYALENYFYRIARESRLKELDFLRKTMIVRILNTSLSLILTKMTIFVTLLCYVTDEKRISSSRVFITILLYEHVRINFAHMFVQGWTDLVEITVTFKRLTDFFLLEESYDSENYRLLPAPTEEAVEKGKLTCGFNMQRLNCKWHAKQTSFTLKNVNLSVKSGDFVVILGSLGAGKSSVLSAVLGELPIADGSVVVQGKIAFISQVPWLFHGTIRENILFGLPYEEEWYTQVLEVCTVNTDIDRMRDGDETEVFMAALSIGQKARISLARAVYSKADIFLMDDPFNCIDVRLSRFILENCIRGILGNKIVVLVSHQIHFLEAATKVVIMANGEFKAVGTYEELLKQGIQFTEEIEELDDILNDDDADKLSRNLSCVVMDDSDEQIMMADAFSTDELLPRKSIIAVKEIEADVYESHKKKSSIHIPTTMTRGLGLYWLYIRSSASTFFMVFLFFLTILLQVLYSGSDYWLEHWVHFEEKKQAEPETEEKTKKAGFDETRSYHIIVYFSIIPALIIVTIVRSLIMFKICINASLSLFCQLTDSLLRASSSFVDTIGVGSGINKFSKDMLVIDELLPATLYDITGVFFEILGAIAILGFCEPWFLIPSVMFLVSCILVYRIYHSTAASLKRIESNARSPVYGHIANSLEGMMTIRAYNQEDMFMDLFDDYMNTHTSSWTLYIASYAWLAVIVDWLSIFLISSICIMFIEQDSSNSVLVGLAIAKAVELSILAQIAVVETGDMETEMISVERVLEFTATAPEGDWETPNNIELPLSWPQQGRIEFKHVTVKGYTGRNVLRNLNFVIEPGQKVGIVGRSGAGKSSLLNSLFRILKVTTGQILIDGIDIKDIGLHDLRKSINVIPQKPHVFHGTLRSNVDPFEEFTDREIWKVLEEVRLYETVKNMDEGLYSLMCPETGWIFTDADTQLLSLARALIRKGKILVCDEATSYLDPETQTFVLRKLKHNFHDCTIVTIAHKVHTVIDCDVIMVLEAGQVIDIGEPHTLIKAKGPFFQLIDNFGESTKEEIIRMAKDAYDNRREERRRTNYSLRQKFSRSQNSEASKDSSKR